MKVATCVRAEICDRLKVAREALGLTQEALAKAVGGSKRGIQNNEALLSVPGGEVICGLVRLGINANWLLTGEGEMLLKDAQMAAAEVPWRAIPDVVRYGAVNEPQGLEAAPVVDVALLTRCIEACALVYGRDFYSLDVPNQVAYAGDLYNRLVRMADSAHAAGALAALSRLEVAGIADQLRVFTQLGWARQFPPNNLPKKSTAA